MVGLSVAATLLAVVLVVGLLAWVRHDLQARGASMRAWWLVVACYAFAAIAWLVAITVPLPIMLAWLATIPAAVATVIPDRLASALGGVGRAGRGRRSGRPRSVAQPHARPAMAHPIGQPRGATTTGVVRRRTTIAPTSRATSQPNPQPNPQPTRQLVEASLPPEPTPSTPAPSEAATPVPGASQPAPPVPAAPEPWQIDEPPATPARTHEEPAPREASPTWRTTAPPPPAPRRITSIGRHRWHAGDLRLAIELLEDASRIPGLDEAARERIDGRLDRLDRFRDAATAELLDLVRDDVHARLVSDAPTIDPDPARTRRIGQLLDELDPRPAGAG